MNISKRFAPPPDTSRWLLAPLFLILLVTSLICPPAQVQAAQPIPQEYELKAVYLYNFLQFVNWPVGPCSATGGRMDEIAVIGDSPICEKLQALQAELKRTRGVELTVHFYGPFVEGMDLSGCRLLFIAQPEVAHIKKILGSLKGKPALLVADNEECLDQGCMITLLAQSNNKIRWAINRRSVEASGLKMNARLLEMAAKVVE